MGTLTRRSILRGMMRGSAVVVGLPLLDIFLDGNGEALAAGAPIPTRFGTWFWGCGVNTARWFPDKVGANYDIKEELSPIAPFRDKVSVFSNFNCILDGKPNLVHWSGAMATLSGTAPNLTRVDCVEGSFCKLGVGGSEGTCATLIAENVAIAFCTVAGTGHLACLITEDDVTRVVDTASSSSWPCR